MKTVGTRELKNRLSRYLGMVRKGETVIVTTRGETVAHIVPPNSEPRTTDGLDGILKQLQAAGHLHRGTRPFRRIKPIKTKGKSASQMVREDRE